MRVAVLGGGLAGSCTALALAERGVRSVLYDRNAVLLSGTATANEGKLHLGHVYAADPSLATARTMIRGALDFLPLIGRWLGGVPGALDISNPFIYAVHRKSLLTGEEVGAHLETVHRELVDAAGPCFDAYPGADPLAPPRRLARSEEDELFAGEEVAAAFATSEIALEPEALARLLRRRIADDPLIEARGGHVVVGVEDEGRGLTVRCDNGAGAASDRFDAVVNALWDGRVGLDAARGIVPHNPLIYRRKFGVRFRLAEDAEPVPSVTIVLGPFGDTVAYGGGLHYASWYPTCMTGTSRGPGPPPEPGGTGETEWRERLVSETLSALGRIVRPVGRIAPGDLLDQELRGGVIVASGESDIDDPASGLHQRWDIGVTSHGRYHSLDPGKLTMAPHFAERCAARVVGD